MILDQLSNLGALVGPEGYEKTTAEWTPSEGADPVVFDISVKTEATVADFEFINMAGRGTDDHSVMARAVHRMVRFHKIGGEPTEEEKLPLDDCARLKPDLLLTLFISIGSVSKKQGKVVPRARRK